MAGHRAYPLEREFACADPPDPTAVATPFLWLTQTRSCDGTFQKTEKANRSTCRERNEMAQNFGISLNRLLGI